MSLLDALMLDATRINIGFAKRTDGKKGCGTQDDPYNSEVFDDVMEDMSMSTTPVHVHLGPGELPIPKTVSNLFAPIFLPTEQGKRTLNIER